MGQRTENFSAMLCLALWPMEAHANHKWDLEHKKWSAWAELDGYYNSDSANELDIDLFLPIGQSAFSLLFLDLEGELFQDDMQDGTFALGIRQMLSGGWNLGIWGGPEVRHTEAENTFWRLSGGLEALHPDYDLRFNTYMPFTDPQSSPSLAQVVLQGNQIFMTGGAELALWGFDGEVGVRVPLETAGLNPNDVELRLYGGGFYFDDDWILEEIAGPKARVELRLYEVIPSMEGTRLTAEYEYSYDNVRGDRHQFGARFRIPFGSGGHRSLVTPAPDSKSLALQPSRPLNRQERRMLDGLRREDIFTTRSVELVADWYTNVVFDSVAYVRDGGNLSHISAAYGHNTLIIVNCDVETGLGNNTIQGNQTVQGGQSTIAVYGVASGTVVNFTAPGEQPTVLSLDNSDVIALVGNRTHIAGLEIDGNGMEGHGINVGSDKWNIAINQNIIRNVASDGIYVDSNNSDVWIFNDTFTDIGAAGILINNDNQIDISNVQMSDIDDDGINISNDNIVAVSDTIIRNVGGDGIEFDNRNEVEMSDTLFEGTFGGDVIMANSNDNDLAGDGNVSNPESIGGGGSSCGDSDPLDPVAERFGFARGLDCLATH